MNVSQKVKNIESEIKKLEKEKGLLLKDDKPPKVSVDALIRKTAKITKPTRHSIHLDRYDVNVSFDLLWEDDNRPGYGNLYFSSRNSKIDTILIAIENHFSYGEMQDIFDIDNDICQSKPYKQMQKEIDAIIKKSDELESKYANYDFYNDVLVPAEYI